MWIAITGLLSRKQIQLSQKGYCFFGCFSLTFCSSAPTSVSATGEGSPIKSPTEILQAAVEKSVGDLVNASKPKNTYLGDGEILVQGKWFNMIVPGWDLSLAPQILMTGEWESWLSNYFLDRVQPGMIALDIGANIGWFASLFASRGASVHAFEPNPRLQRILRKNLFLNAGGNTPTCSINPCAVSEASSNTKMRFPHWLVGGGGLHDFDQSSFLDSLIDEDVDVSVITIDEFASQKGIEAVDLIKIDIEGFEEKAIAGAKNLISRSDNLTLAIEYTRGNYSSDFPEYLFGSFDKAYIPQLGEFVDLAYVQAYDKGELHPSQSHFDIVFTKNGS